MTAGTFVLLWLIGTIVTNVIQALFNPIEIKVNNLPYAVMLMCWITFLFVAACIVLL